MLSGLLFGTGHIFLAFIVTDLDLLVLIFTLYEGLICAFVRIKHGIHVGVTGEVCSIGVLQSMKEFKKRQIKVVFASELLTKELMEKNFLP